MTKGLGTQYWEELKVVIYSIFGHGVENEVEGRGCKGRLGDTVMVLDQPVLTVGIKCVRER